ncbi:MAG TPA: FAD-dependent monooxygenase [Pseudolabrys sp.]
MIGADGVHSAVRQTLFGEGDPRFTGFVAWRGLVAANRLPPHLLRPVGTNWVGPGGHIVHYFLRRGEIFNFVAAVERCDWLVESWTERGTAEECAADFAGWHEDIQTIISLLEKPYKWALLGREPMERWSEGRITLLGDACHPMLPFMAQGAAQAIEDGATLAAVLARSADVPEALRRYEALRLPRTARIQTTAAGNKTRNHLPDGPEQRARDARMAAGAADWSIGASKWVYDHDAVAAAETGSLGLPPQ